MFHTYTFIVLLSSKSLNSREPNFMLNMQETRGTINKNISTNKLKREMTRNKTELFVTSEAQNYNAIQEEFPCL